jgi:hypothetical protein
LFISLNKTLELAIKVLILALKYTAMVLESINFFAQVTVATLETLVGEAEIILFTTRNGQVFISSARFCLKTIQLSGKSAVTGEFSLRTVN